MKRLSVIIPVYNAAKTIRRCIDSILHQDMKGIEVILVNDGSSDDSESICLSYQQLHADCIRLINQENRGPSSARNRGIDHSTGEYLAFIDADDYIEPDMFSTMIQCAEQNQAEMVICGYVEEESKGKRLIHYRFTDGLYKGESILPLTISMFERQSKQDIPPYSWVRIIRRTVIIKNGIRFYENLKRTEDFHFWARVHLVLSSVFVLGSQPFYHYVQNSSSITHNYVKDYWDSVKFIYRDLKKAIPNNTAYLQALNDMLVMRGRLSLQNAVLCNRFNEAYSIIKNIVYDEDFIHANNTFQIDKQKRFVWLVKNMQSNHKVKIIGVYLVRWVKQHLGNARKK